MTATQRLKIELANRGWDCNVITLQRMIGKGSFPLSRFFEYLTKNTVEHGINKHRVKHTYSQYPVMDEAEARELLTDAEAEALVYYKR